MCTTRFPPWCEQVGVFSTQSVKRFFSAKFVTKRESVVLSELEALARMGVYDMCSAAV